MKNMNYKILINESGVPVLIEVPEKPDDKPFRKTDDLDGFLKLDIEYQRALSAALADKSKHIQIKDVEEIFDKQILEYCKLDEVIGQTFDLPPNIGVSFEVNRFAKEHNAYLWKNMDKDTFVPVGLLPEKLAILTPITEAPSPSQVLTAEESDNDLVEKFMAIIPLADPGFVENLAFECSKVAKKYSTLQTQQLQNRVKELEGGLSGSIKVGEGTAITVGNYATICPHDGHNCYDSMCGRTTNICNNSHSFSKETILNDGDKDLIKQAHNEAIEACFKLIKRVGWLPDLEVFDGTALKIMEELEKEIKK